MRKGRRNGILVAVTTGMLLHSIGSAALATNDQVHVEVLPPPIIVQGIPCPVSVLVENRLGFHRLSAEESERLYRDSRQEWLAYLAKANAASVQFDEAYPFNPHPRVTIQIVGSTDDRIVKTVPPVFGVLRGQPVEEIEAPPRTTFSPGTAGQVIFEISHALAEVPVGEYRLILTVHSGGPQSWQSVPSRAFKLLRLTEDQAAQVRRVFPQFNPLKPLNDREFQSLSWVYWLRGVTNNVPESQKLLPEEVAGQLAAHLFVAKAVQVGAVEKLTPEDLDHFPAHLQGLANLFRYEVLYRQGKQEAAAQVWQTLRTTHLAMPDAFFYNAQSTNRVNLGLLEGLIRSQRTAAQSPN